MVYAPPSYLGSVLCRVAVARKYRRRLFFYFFAVFFAMIRA